MFANCSEDDEIYPLTVSEIAEAQKADAQFKHCFKRNAVIDKGLEINKKQLPPLKIGKVPIFKRSKFF